MRNGSGIGDDGVKVGEGGEGEMGAEKKMKERRKGRGR